jgi:hypothetical protein
MSFRVREFLAERWRQKNPVSVAEKLDELCFDCLPTVWVVFFLFVKSPAAAQEWKR